MLEVLEFELAGVGYGLPTSRVVEVAPRVRITPLPGVSAPVLGVVAVRGAIVPAVDLRVRLGHPRREARWGDHFIIAQSARRVVALVVDHVRGLSRAPLATIQRPPIPSAQLVGVVMQPEGLLLIEDLDAVLSLDEERELDDAVAALEGSRP